MQLHSGGFCAPYHADVKYHRPGVIFLLLYVRGQKQRSRKKGKFFFISQPCAIARANHAYSPRARWAGSGSIVDPTVAPRAQRKKHKGIRKQYFCVLLVCFSCAEASLYNAIHML